MFGPGLRLALLLSLFSFFFNDTATTEIYTLSLHDALPISHDPRHLPRVLVGAEEEDLDHVRSEEHTSELQSPWNLVCRLLLEKEKNGILASKMLGMQRIIDSGAWRVDE